MVELIKLKNKIIIIEHNTLIKVYRDKSPKQNPKYVYLSKKVLEMI